MTKNSSANHTDARPMTTVEFHLPRGYIAPDDAVHADGVMRLATAADELSAARDPQVLENAAYLPVTRLLRVVTKLGTVEVTPQVIEGLFASDLAYLTQLYDQLNHQAVVPFVYRSVKVVLLNATDENLVVQGVAAVHGSWDAALKPAQGMVVPAQSAAEWMTVSTEIGCGSSAFVRFASSHGHAEVRWNLPWTGQLAVTIEPPPGMECPISVEPGRPDRVAVVVTVKARRA